MRKWMRECVKARVLGRVGVSMAGWVCWRMFVWPGERVCDMRQRKNDSWVTGYTYESICVFVGGYMCKCQSITIRDHNYSHTHCTPSTRSCFHSILKPNCHSHFPSRLCFTPVFLIQTDNYLNSDCKSDLREQLAFVKNLRLYWLMIGQVCLY